MPPLPSLKRMTTFRIRRPRASVLLALALTALTTPAVAATRSDLVRANDNRQAAGTLTSGTLSLACGRRAGGGSRRGPAVPR